MSEKYSANRPVLARHRLIDFYGCNPNLISFAKFLEPVMMDAATLAGCKIVKVSSQQFNPLGASVVVMVAESHLSIHTWPEYGKALVDIFASGEGDFDAAIDHISKLIQSTSKKEIHIERG